ncbi:glycerophosphodiester phosphodiesterase [Brachybacterium hainanense]|uniref:Glycerophosphodiester phosphodiesterase n=1 Tax=Brachybacterium hainanense TaxID=1541174 RepID=A0ABV6R9J7_9MICO
MSEIPAARPRIVGHRGAAALAPENTLASFRRAVADGAQLLECDVHLSRDGHVVIMHDETIDRTAHVASPLRTGAIADLTRAELETVLLGADGDGEPVPFLDQLLEETTVPLFIEVKAAAAAAAVAAQLESLPGDAPGRASTVITFHAAAAADIRRERPDTPVSYLVDVIDEAALARAAELGAVGIGPWVQGLSLHAARAVHEAGLELNPWTVNEAPQLDVALACGADTITTDDPAWVARELDARGL